MLIYVDITAGVSGALAACPGIGGTVVDGVGSGGTGSRHRDKLN